MNVSIPYANWPVIEEATFEGWRFGTCMKYVGEKWGDAFVESPDGWRAGLVWELSDGPVEQILAPDAERWGVYKIGFPCEMKDVEDLVANFLTVFPQLRVLHEAVAASMSVKPAPDGKV